jgi:hypothetical protein
MQIVVRILKSNEHFDELRNNGAKVFLQLYLDSERQMSNTSSDRIFTAGARSFKQISVIASGQVI